MADDALPQALDQSSTRLAAIAPTGGMEPSGGDWNTAAFTPPAESSLGNVTVYLHAFRRHWLLSVGIGLAAATMAGAAVFLLVGNKYAATAVLRIDMQEKSVLGEPVTVTDRDRFEIFKNTQKELMLNRLVLMAALRKSEVANIPTVKEQQLYGGEVDWLQKRLSVNFPGKAEVMTVDMALPDAKEATILVNAVVDSYLNDVVNAERELKRQRLIKIDNACAEKETQIRANRNDLKEMTKNFGTSAEPETITHKQRLMIEELGILRTELLRSQFEAGKLEGDLAAQKALLKALDSSDSTGEELDAMINADPIARQLSIELNVKTMERLYLVAAAAKGAKNKYLERYDRDLKVLQEQFDAKKKELAKQLAESGRTRKRGPIEAEILKLQMALEVGKGQRDELAKKVQIMRDEVNKFGGSTVDIEMLRTGLRSAEATLTDLNREREKMRIELQSTPRITLVEKAEEPPMPSNRVNRIAMTVLATLAALCCPAVLIVLLDVQARRINTADEVAKGLRLPVIGSMPLIPSRVIRQLGSPSKRYHSWHMRLTESVDGITARILHRAEIDQTRVIMVSSAIGGEGKTTLATQLAMSLARTGRTVVLVDFDLRRPSFNELFGVPLEPGVSELLRRQTTTLDIVHADVAENLSVVAAGRWDRRTLASLSNGCAASLFQQLRESYEFVVIDTSPLLPVADARFVSQHVDAVVLSVLRDISQAPKIQAACDILAAFGVRSVEAVVTGDNAGAYGRHEAYESTISS